MEMSEEHTELAALQHTDRLRMLCARREAERTAEPTARNAMRELVEFGRQLHAEGGEALMLATYDATQARYGHRGVFGASPAWTGIGSWSA